jgi:hypothetical protein
MGIASTSAPFMPTGTFEITVVLWLVSQRSNAPVELSSYLWGHGVAAANTLLLLLLLLHVLLIDHLLLLFWREAGVWRHPAISRHSCLLLRHLWVSNIVWRVSSIISLNSVLIVVAGFGRIEASL